MKKSSFQKFFTIEKIDDEQRVIEGIASTDSPDGQGGIWKGQRYVGDIVDSAAIEEALPDYLKWGNVREMHQPSAVGVVTDAQISDDGLKIVVKIADDNAWKKIKADVYKGFSIGGKIVEAVLEKSDNKFFRRILKMLLSEISLVDRPANPHARITAWKAETIVDEAGRLQRMTWLIEGLQRARNQCELQGLSAACSLINQVIALLLMSEQGDDGSIAVKLEAEKIHGVIKGLAALADDDMSKAVLVSYSTPLIEEENLQVEELLIDEALSKAIEPVVEGVRSAMEQVVEGVTSAMQQLGKQQSETEQRLKKIEEQPATVIFSDSSEKDGMSVQGENIKKLRRKIAVEPDPIRRNQYQKLLDQALAKEDK